MICLLSRGPQLRVLPGAPFFVTNSIVVFRPRSRVPLISGTLSSDVEVVIVQYGVEKQEEAALSLMAPHWIIREHHHMALANGHINHRWRIRQFRSAGQHSTDQKIFFIGGKSQDDPRSQGRRREKCALLKPLLVCELFAAR